MFTRHALTHAKTAGNWLLPIVPPIVASVPAALLATSWPAALQTDMLALA
jgi:tellurite resistance protein TehA-like permease